MTFDELFFKGYGGKLQKAAVGIFFSTMFIYSLLFGFEAGMKNGIFVASISVGTYMSAIYIYYRIKYPKSNK